MIRTLLKNIFSYPANDIELLLIKAKKFPRYQNHKIHFRGMTINVTDLLSVTYQLKEYFADGRMNFKSINPSPVIYDCGSNVGISILFYKKIFPAARITAFEPDPKVFHCLEQNMIQNGLTDVNLIDKAVWINNNGIEFGSEGADGGSVFFEGNKIIVPTVRLKEFFEKETRIDCLKIDIEGAEVEVIEDCKNELNKVKYLYVEYHSWKQQLQQLDKLLQNLSDNGFRYSIHPIGENMLQPFIQNNPKNAMDIQLDIHAINERLN